jgi:hypothetical protein
MAQMDSEILVRVFFGISGDFEKPRARDYDSGAHQSLFQDLDRILIGGVTHSRVVAVDHEDFVGGFLPQPLSQRTLSAGGIHCTKAGCRGDI